MAGEGSGSGRAPPGLPGDPSPWAPRGTLNSGHCPSWCCPVLQRGLCLGHGMPVARPSCPDQRSAQRPPFQTPKSGGMQGLWPSSVPGMALQLRGLPRRGAVRVRGACVLGSNPGHTAPLQPCSGGPGDTWQGPETPVAVITQRCSRPLPRAGQPQTRQHGIIRCH